MIDIWLKKACKNYPYTLYTIPNISLRVLKIKNILINEKFYPCYLLKVFYYLIIYVFCIVIKTEAMKKIIYSDKAPQPIGPYSQAIEAGNLVFVSGQIAIDPATGKVIEPGDIKAEAKQVMENIKAILKASGCEMNQIIKCSIFLLDMNMFADVNAVYGEYFTKDYPARETIQVSGLPKNVRIEISAIAMK